MSMRTCSRGFTLLEVLIAILVLSIGLLGLAALQATGLRTSHSANLRSQATQLAYEMTDAMRANRAGYEGGHYNNPSPQDNRCVWDGSTPNVCTPQQMARHDVFEWGQSIARELPQGVAVVCRDGTPNDGGDSNGNGAVEAAELACDNTGDLYAVKLWWIDDREVNEYGNPVFQRFATGFRP